MRCRQFELELARRRLPPIVPLLEASYARSNVNFEQLMAGQITWGQFIRDANAIGAELDLKYGGTRAPPLKTTRRVIQRNSDCQGAPVPAAGCYATAFAG
jgi:hypothetical protein